MRKNSVAVLDIRSSDIRAVVGERGVNNTFIIKSKYSCDYDGYAEGELIDAENFVSAVREAVKATLSAVGRKIKTFYIGVPGEFTELICTDKALSFHNAKKITSADCNALIDLSTPKTDGKKKIIRSGCSYYVLSDKRKMINPVGAVSDGLQGKCCFYLCAVEFINVVKRAFEPFASITALNLIPANFAEANYLIEPEKRDECAVLFDLGYISSTYSVVCGNGLLYSESFSVGVGHIAFYLASELDIPFPVASAFLSKVNLNAKEKLTSDEECVYEGKTYSYSTAELRNIIREGLDGICETIEECRLNFTGRSIDGKPLLVTGEGINVIRGTADHLSGRLEKAVDVIAPKVPYYDKPQFSSVLSLLDTALGDSDK